MLSNSVHQALAALEAAVEALGAADWEDPPVRERLEALQQWETSARVQRARSCGVARGLDRCDELGTMGAKVIADVLRISPRESRRRLRDAELVSARRTLTGQSLPPPLPATAKAWDSGLLDTEHLRVIERFRRELPEELQAAEVETAEAFLAEKAAELRPDQLEVLADRLALTLNPDGRFSDDDRARKRGFTWCGRQRLDGMSIGKLVASPELRATIDALLAKFAAPGMCNPDDQSPTVNTEPTDEAAQRDKRSCAQRQHDALSALLKSQLGNPKLGQHNGLPVTIIATTTVEQLCARTGHAVTASGTLLPMRDPIRMASHSWHYLAVFAQHSQQPVYLGRSKRIASADQRIALYAKDRGCTAPGCDVPGYLTEVQHIDEWTAGGATDVENLNFSCKPHHRLLTRGGWKTRKRKDGSTEWLPPPHLPLGPGTNDFHHPERLLP